MSAYYVPENGGSNNNLPFSIPIGGGNGLFGNGSNLAEIFGFAIIASMFGWGNGGFGNNGGMNGAGYISNQLNNDSGRALIMQAITSNGEASRAAIQNLANTIGQDFNLVNSAVQNVQNALAQLAAAQGTSTLQIINSIQSGNTALANQFQQCCCQNQRMMEQQTREIQNSINGAVNAGNANTAAILGKLSEMQTQNLQDKLDAARAENTRLAGEISQQQQNAAIAGMIGNAIAPINAALVGIRGEVDAIKRCQTPTITLPNNQYTAVPTLYANAAADFVASYYANRLSGATTSSTASSGSGTTGA